MNQIKFGYSLSLNLKSMAWSTDLDAWLIDASPALSFDWLRISTALVRQGQHGFSPDSCRMRFAELSNSGGGGGGQGGDDDDELDLDALLGNESIAGEKEETSSFQPASATINRAPGQTIVSDSSAFDFDADAALAAADAELGALMNDALEKRGAHSLASESNISSIRDSAATSRAKEVALQSAMESASKARKVRQEQMFDRVLESLGGPLDAAASARISAPWGANLVSQQGVVDTEQQKVAKSEHPVVSQAEMQRITAEAEEADTVKAIAEVSASFFNGKPVDSSSSKLGFSLASVDDVKEILRDGGHSEFSIAESSDSALSGWDLILKDVRINPASTSANFTSKGTSIASNSNASSSTSVDIPTEGSGSDFAEILAILNSEARSKPKEYVKAAAIPPQPPQQHSVKANSSSDNDRIGSVPKNSLSSSPKVLDARSSASLSSTNPAQPPPPVVVVSKGSSSSTTESNVYVGKNLDIDEDDDELDWRAQRAKLKSRVTSFLPPATEAPPRPSTLVDTDEELLQLLQRGREVLESTSRGDMTKNEDDENDDDDGDETGVKGLDESQLASSFTDSLERREEDYPIYVSYKRRIGGGGEGGGESRDAFNGSNIQKTNQQPALQIEQAVSAAAAVKETTDSTVVVETNNIDEKIEEEEEMAFSTLIRPRTSAAPLSTVSISQALREEEASKLPANLPWNQNIVSPPKTKPINARKPLSESQLLISTSIARGEPAHKK